jgi:hypothetical protein
MVLTAVLKKPDVTDVTVVEIDQDVIDLVAPAYAGVRILQGYMGVGVEDDLRLRDDRYAIGVTD